jgi:hypothetical protein
MRMETIEDLAELAALVDEGRSDALYVRWSMGPDADLHENGSQASRDALTGVELPGLSANSLKPEPWWGDRSLVVWVARKLYDYHDMRRLRGRDVRPWVFAGEQCGTGPDNEPLVICHSPIGWVSEGALRQSRRLIDGQDSDEWGPLHRAD